MALQKSFTKFGYTFAQAYHQVNRLIADPKRSPRSANVNIRVYVNEAAKDADSEANVLHEFGLTMSESEFDTYLGSDVLDEADKNPYNTIYDWLKDSVTSPVDYTTGTTDV